MLDPIQQIKEQITDVLVKALYKAAEDGSLSYKVLPCIKVEKSRYQQLGDFYSNLAIEMVRQSGRPSGYIAETLLQHAELSGTYIERIEAASPGFINIFLKPKWLYDVLAFIIKEKDEYGRLDIGRDQKVLVSFAYADIGTILWGDCLANILETVGYDVAREFYVGDHQFQEGADEIMSCMRQWDVAFSTWFVGRQLYEAGDIDEAVGELDVMGNIRRSGKAIWFISGDLKTLLLDESGAFTDLALHIAYHRRKVFKEGYDRVIDIWPAGYQDTFDAVRSAMSCFGCEPERLERLPVYRGTSNIGDCSDTVSLAHRDIWRFISINPERRYDIKELSKQQRGNPLFEIQYAYARICSILRHMDSHQLALIPPEEVDFSMLRHPSEQALMRKLADFPHEIALAFEQRRPGRLADYLVDTALLFHEFYDQCRVRISNRDLMYARLGLTEAARIVLANGLYVLNIQAPERM